MRFTYSILILLATQLITFFPVSSNEIQDSTKTDKSLLILEESLFDIGRWIWWTGDKDMFHLEFAGTQLYIDAVEKGKAPTGILGIQFEGLKCIVRMSNDTLNLIENVEWFNNIQKDQSKPFPLSPGSITLTNPELVRNYLNAAQQITFFRGGLKDIQELNTEQTFIGFWAGTAGMIIIADEMKLTTHHGKIKLKEIEELNKQWWDYWKSYWDKKLSGEPLPYDYNCEIIVPKKEETPID